MGNGQNNISSLAYKKGILSPFPDGLKSYSPSFNHFPERLSRQRYFDRMAEIWEQEHGQKIDTNLTGLIERFQLKPGQIVLDAGCGTGRLVPFILQRIGPEGKLLAVDISEKMLSLARQKYRAHNLIYLQADACQLEAKNFFDRIICLCFFPHLEDKKEALRIFRTYLKEDGQLIIAHTSSRQEVNAFHSRLPEPLCKDIIPEKEEMISWLHEAGLVVLEFEDDQVYFLRAIPGSPSRVPSIGNK